MNELSRLVELQMDKCSEGGEGNIITMGTIKDLKSYAKELGVDCSNCIIKAACKIKQNYSVNFCSEFKKN